MRSGGIDPNYGKERQDSFEVLLPRHAQFRIRFACIGPGVL
jgi:hypothetical protein